MAVLSTFSGRYLTILSIPLGPSDYGISASMPYSMLCKAKLTVLIASATAGKA